MRVVYITILTVVMYIPKCDEDLEHTVVSHRVLNDKIKRYRYTVAFATVHPDLWNIPVWDSHPQCQGNL